MKLTVRMRRMSRMRRSRIAAVKLAVGVKTTRSLPQQRGRKSLIRTRGRRRLKRRIWKREAMNRRRRRRRTIHQWWVGEGALNKMRGWI